jgi:hypothetical protein
VLEVKVLAAAFIAALLFSALAVNFGTVQASTDARGVPKPSVPEFTLQLVDNFVQVTIQNQPIIPNGHDTANIFYNIRIKDHDATNWINDTVPNPSQGIRGYIGETGTSGPTIILKSINALHVLLGSSDSLQVDYQIEAINGYLNSSVMYGPLPIGVDPNSQPVIIVNTSGWSNTQTITIPLTTPSPTSSPSPTPTSSPSPIPVPGQSYFFVESNSTVSELFFNSTSAELSFTVNGTSGTAGYVKVTIAKSLVSNVQNVKAYLDGNQLDVAITSNDDSWLLSFTYTHSTHQVRISFATNTGTTTFLGVENWIWIGAVIIIVVIGAGLLVYFKKRKH